MLRLLLAAVVLLAPLGQAALLEDAQGDVRIGANDAPAAAPASPAYASMDLVSLDVIEEADAFTFAVQVDDLAQAEDTAPDGEICDVWMTHNGREFRIHMTRLTPAILGGRAELRSRDAGGAWDRHAEADLESTFDLATDIITLRLARADLADASGAAPYPGRVQGTRLARRTARREGAVHRHTTTHGERTKAVLSRPVEPLCFRLASP